MAFPQFFKRLITHMTKEGRGVTYTLVVLIPARFSIWHQQHALSPDLPSRTSQKLDSSDHTRNLPVIEDLAHRVTLIRNI